MFIDRILYLLFCNNDYIRSLLQRRGHLFSCTMVKVARSKQTRKQIASSIALERRKTKRRLSGAGETEITDEMVGEKLATSCADRIHGMLPKPKSKRPTFTQPEKKIPRPWSTLPAKPLKRNVLWMAMKDQDQSSTMSLSDEIQSFADYVAVRRHVLLKNISSLHFEALSFHFCRSRRKENFRYEFLETYRVLTEILSVSID